MQSRFRLFAGPNGSGKSFFFKFLKKNKTIHTEIYVSADSIEADLKKACEFNFNAYRVTVSEEEFKNHIRASGLFLKMESDSFLKELNLQSGVLKISVHLVDSYLASFIASYLVARLFESKQSFCFETVMSHESKIEILKLAVKNGYKTYLYFVFTEDVALNEYRVQLRVIEGGHSVAVEKIRERFKRSFQLLKAALHNTDTAFLIDNSQGFNVVAKQTNGKLDWISTKPVVLKNLADL